MSLQITSQNCAFSVNTVSKKLRGIETACVINTPVIPPTNLSEK